MKILLISDLHLCDNRNSEAFELRRMEKLAAFINSCRENFAVTACFNPAAFAKAGEMPFLYSYKAGRFIKTMGQLDIVDSTWDGDEQELACGNAEVKEMMSILRCHNFSGFFCIGGGAAYPGTLEDAVDDFVYLLDNM